MIPAALFSYTVTHWPAPPQMIVHLADWQYSSLIVLGNATYSTKILLGDCNDPLIACCMLATFALQDLEQVLDINSLEMHVNSL